jgi:hypothetical protein
MTTTSVPAGEFHLWVEDILVICPCDYDGKIKEDEFHRRIAKSLEAHAEKEKLTPAQAELYLKCKAREV